MSSATISHKPSEMSPPRRGISTQEVLPRPSFSSVPDFAHAAVASYLPSVDMMALMRTAKGMQEVYMRHMSQLRLRLYTKGTGVTGCKGETEWWWRRVALIRLLGRLSGLTELCTHSILAVGVLMEVLRAGYVKGLRVLRVSCSYQNYKLEPEIRELALALRAGALPALRELSVGCLSEMGFGVLMQALAAPGVCSSLDTLQLRTWVTNLQLQLVAEALQGRPGLQTLKVKGGLRQTQFNAVCEYLRCAHCLLELHWHVSGFRLDHQPLALALKDGMRCLRQLTLAGFKPAHPEMFARAVGAAIRAGALAALEDLTLRNVDFGLGGWLTVCGAIGRGHGCRSLRRFMCDYVTAEMYGGIALALRMGAFTELQELHMVCRCTIEELQDFAAAVQAHGLPHLRTLKCNYRSEECDISSLGDAFSTGACPHLEELQVLWGSASSFVLRLASHIATHALRRLRRLDLSAAYIDGLAVVVLAGALIEGGCPQLQILKLCLYDDDSSSCEEAVRMLASILGGDAPCSSTLHRFYLHGDSLGYTSLSTLAEGLSKPGAIRLSTLYLGSVCDGPWVQGGWWGGHVGVTTLLKALRGEAGSKLRELYLCYEDPTWESIQMWSDAITHGALSCLEDIAVLSGQEPELAKFMTEMLMQQLRLRRSSRVDSERSSAALHRWLKKGMMRAKSSSDGPSFLLILVIGGK